MPEIDLEKRARELMIVYWCDEADINNPNFPSDKAKILAKHVEREILKARIESLRNLPVGMFDSTPYRDALIKDLTAQLENL